MILSHLTILTEALEKVGIDYVLRDGDSSDGEYTYQYLFIGKPEDAQDLHPLTDLNFQTTDLDHLLRCGYKYWEFENKSLVSWPSS